MHILPIQVLCTVIFMFYPQTRRLKGIMTSKDIRKRTESQRKRWEALRKEKKINLKWLLRFKVDNGVIAVAAWGILVPAH